MNYIYLYNKIKLTYIKNLKILKNINKKQDNQIYFYNTIIISKKILNIINYNILNFNIYLNYTTFNIKNFLNYYN